MKHILSVLVENHAGVLSKVVGLFSRRGFNIDSLAVGVTKDPSISRITIMVNSDDYTIEQMSKQLNKLIDVIKIKRLEASECVERELSLIKIKATSKSRQEIIQIANIFRSKIIDVSKNSITIEITGPEEKIGAFLEMAEPFGIMELVRGGAIALGRGENILS